MRFQRLLWSTLALAAFACLAKAADSDELPTDAPELSVTAAFPENNPFGHVVNGERNRINLLVENTSEHNVTLVSVAGAFHDPQTDILVKNATTIPYGLKLIAGTSLQIPYQFHSEFRAGEIRLSIWASYVANDIVYRVPAFDSIVQVVEPDISIFNYQVVSTYLITAAFLGGLGYFAFITFFPKPKKGRRPVTTSGGKQSISSPVGTVTATGAGGYEEEWIPVHHLKKNKKAPGAVSSGEELSGTETSGVEARKRKGRK